jgi:hypothetical protein
MPRAALNTAGPSSPGPRGRQGRPAARPSKPSRAAIGQPGLVGRSRSRSRSIGAPQASAHRRGPGPAVIVVRWSVLGPCGIGNRWSSAGTSGHDGPAGIAGHAACTATTLDAEPGWGRVQVPLPTPQDNFPDRWHPQLHQRWSAPSIAARTPLLSTARTCSYPAAPRTPDCYASAAGVCRRSR